MGLVDSILRLAPDHYWPLTDATGATTAAAVPSTSNATIVGSASAGAAGPLGGRAWTVNGAGGSYLSGPDAATARFTGAAFSISAWVYLNSVVSFATAVGKAPNSGGTTHEYLLRLNGTTNWQFWLSQSGNGNGYASSSGGSAPVTGTWVNLTGTWATGGVGCTIYVNGSGTTSTSTTGTPSGGTTNVVRLGDYQATGINGRLAHVAIWARTLTATEAGTIYTEGLRSGVAY